MPKTKKFKKLLKNCKKQYGLLRGNDMAYAIAHKLKWRI